MNNVTLVGRLTADPKKTVTQSGATIVRFNLAVNRQFKNEQGEYETDFINCIVFGKTAETTNEYCKKGDLVAVKGRIQTGSYTAQDGSKRYTTEVVASNLSFSSGDTVSIPCCSHSCIKPLNKLANSLVFSSWLGVNT